jgi:hypothetical protein
MLVFREQLHLLPEELFLENQAVYGGRWDELPDLLMSGASLPKVVMYKPKHGSMQNLQELYQNSRSWCSPL